MNRRTCLRSSVQARQNEEFCMRKGTGQETLRKRKKGSAGAGRGFAVSGGK